MKKRLKLPVGIDGFEKIRRNWLLQGHGFTYQDDVRKGAEKQLCTRIRGIDRLPSRFERKYLYRPQ